MNPQLNLVKDHIFFIDKSWRIMKLNKAAANYLGKPREELEGGLVWDLFPSGMSYPNYLRSAMEKQRVEHWEDFNESVGEWFQSSAFGYEKGIFLSCTNISKEKQAIENLKSSEIKLNAVFNSMNDGFLLIDDKFNILAFNEKAKLILNSKTKVGDDIRKYLLEDISVDFSKNIKQAIQGVKSQINIKVDNDQIWMRLSFNLVGEKLATGYNWISITLTDIDEIMRSKVTLQKNIELLEQIQWVQSHRFRASMSRVLGLMNLTKMDGSISDKEKYLKLIEYNIIEMDNVLKDMVKNFDTRFIQ